LSYYGSFWIKQAITHALASQSKAMRLPTHVLDKLGKMRRVASRLEEELGREPTDEELAAEVGTSSLRVNQMRMAAIRPASLDAPLNGEFTRTYAETVADEKAESPCDKLQGKALTEMLREMIQTLDRREQAILRLRFGLVAGSPKTFDEIGEKLGISDERVRQLHNAALEKLRRRIKNLENRSLSLAAPRSANQCKVRL
jgi:RNA polymerase primary sigma factor